MSQFSRGNRDGGVEPRGLTDTSRVPAANASCTASEPGNRGAAYQEAGIARDVRRPPLPPSTLTPKAYRHTIYLTSGGAVKL